MRKLCIMIIYAFCAVSLFSQNNPDLSAKVFDYYAKLPQEKIYVHTDKSVYLAGDTVWFRTYVLDAATNQVSSRSKFVYIELLDNAADTVVMRMKVKESPTLTLPDREGNFNTPAIFANGLALPKKLKDGTYTLAAYTQWMRNFDEEGFFKKQLSIVSSVGAGLVSAQEKSSGPNVLVDRNRLAQATSIQLTLHPEGGNLLSGVNQRLAYKAVDSNGLGVDVTVRLLNEAGVILEESKSQHLGMGEVHVFVSPDNRLFLEATTKDGRTVCEPLPKALSYGATLSVTQRSGNLIVQPLATDGFSLASLQLLVYGAGNLMSIGKLSQTAPIKISQKDLKPGVVNIALVNPVTKQVYAERLAFIR